MPRAKKKYSYASVLAAYETAQDERSEWESEWRQISDHLLPGRGIYQTYSKPRKRKLTADKIINTVAEDALYVLTSGMHGGLTSPSRPWFRLEWADDQLNYVEPLKMWLQQADSLLHKGLHVSNFYSIINSFYVEYAGFGTGAVYVGEDTDDDHIPFRFELLTAGEYAFTLGAAGRPATFYRTLFLSPRQIVDQFGDRASKECKDAVDKNSPAADKVDKVVVEFVVKDKYQDKEWTRICYEVTGSSSKNSTSDKNQEPLDVSGFYEFPYPFGRWSTIGADTYGIGPGSRALPDIKRLQQMEKAFLMATHKAINPPLNIPSRLLGKVNTLPGGENYYANPNEVISELYQMRFDYQGVSLAVERVEQRIQRNFFNDIFLTAARDPNATPYKATEVNAREQEKMLRLGPVIERLQHEFLQPMIERCFNIMLRKELLPPIPPEYQEMVGEYQINLISPLATAQRSVALQGINSFMAFIGNAAQFDQKILDNVDVDAAAREYADITGVQLGVLRPQEQVDMIRKQRAEQMRQQQEKEEMAARAQIEGQVNEQRANARKAESEAAMNQLEAQALAEESGIM